MANISYNRNDICKALQEAGLQEGDTAYFSTSLGMVGIAEGVQTLEQLNALFFAAIKDVLGPTGTILIPTYSYTFGESTKRKPKIFDPRKTPAQIGPFPNYFLCQKDVIRSRDPMVSIAGLGSAAAKLFQNLPPTSYGKGCLYERMLNHPNMKCVSIGLGPNWTPFIHYADAQNKVPYRYDKLFYGGIKDPTSHEVDYTFWLYTVRALINESRADAHQVGALATENNIWSYAPLGRARIYVCNYKKYYAFIANIMQTNKWALACGPACNVIENEQERIQSQSIEKAQTYPDSSKQLIDFLYDQPRTVSGRGISQCLKTIKQHYPITISKIPTGTNVYDWIVPEEWKAKHGEISKLTGEKILTDTSGQCIIHPHSKSFEGELSWTELNKHLILHKKQTDLKPISGSFNDREWSLGISQKEKEKLTDESYRVKLTTMFAMGHLKNGEWIIEGKSKKSILLCCYLDPYLQANHGLSGLIAALTTMELMEKNSLNLTYRLAILSGNIGFAAYVHPLNAEHILAAIHVTMLGRNMPFSIQNSATKNSLETTIQRHWTQGNGNILPFGTLFDPQASGNNPNARNSLRDVSYPNIVLARTQQPNHPEFPFKEYKTSADHPELIQQEALATSSQHLYQVLKEIDRDLRSR